MFYSLFLGFATQIQCPLGGQVQKAQLQRVRHEVLLAIRAQKPPVGPQSGSEIEQVSPLAHGQQCCVISKATLKVSFLTFEFVLK